MAHLDWHIEPKGRTLFSEESMPADMRRAIRFMELLEQHFREQHGIAFYAFELNLTVKQLNRRLRFYYGRSAYELIQERIHFEALKLVGHTEMSMKEICFSLGISDPSWFTKCFKKLEGMEPKCYRQQVRGSRIP